MHSRWNEEASNQFPGDLAQRVYTSRLLGQDSTLVIHGGGHRPFSDACGAPKTPVAFLYGTGNPLHDISVRLHDHYEACGADLRTTLLPKADHDAELRALDTNGEAITDWLLARRKTS